jgi:hypothetical protein
MSKKFTTIEEQLTEGFWDAILNKAKRAGLAAGAALGSNHTRGKLDANTFATELYNQFKLWQGQTNMPSDMNSIAMFMRKQINMNPKFVKAETGVNVGGGSNQASQPQQNSSQNNGHDFEDPLGHVGGNAGTSNSGDNSTQSNYKPEGNDFKPVLTAVGDFMRYGQYGQFKKARDAIGFDRNATKEYSTSYDGSFIFAPGNTVDSDLEQLLKSVETDSENNSVADIAAALKQKNLFGTWEDFKKTIPGADRIEKNSKEEADLFRQASTQAVKSYHYNFPKNLNRFVLAAPPPQPDVQAQSKKLFFNDADPAQVAKTSESVDSYDNVLLEAGGISDGELRKHFMQIAQHALRDGEFKIAANNTINMLRGDNVVGNAVQTGNGNSDGNSEGGDNQNNKPAGGSILNKAESLGHVLGIDINEFTLLKFKKKDLNTYREFMGFLNKQQGDSFTDPFLKYAKETLEPYYDFSEAKPDPKANKDVNAAPDAKSQDGNDEEDENGEAGTTNDNGLTFYDIDRRQMAWDPKDEMLIVRSTKNGKVNERTYKRTEDGWVNDRDAAVQEKNIKLVDSWYDRVMAKSGGEAAQDDQPATPEKTDPTLIPNGATVTNPKNNGKYKFNGKSWFADNGQEIPAGKGSDALSTLYRRTNGLPEPTQTTAAQPAANENPAATEKPSVSQDSDNGKRKSPAVEPGQNMPEQGAKVKIASTGAEYTFDGVEWEDAQGNAIMAPSGHHKDTNGDDYSSQKYLTRLYNFEKTGGKAEDFSEPLTSRLKLDAPKAQPETPKAQPQQANGQPKQQAAKQPLTPDEEDAVVNSKPEPKVGNAPIPVDAKLSHDGNIARKLKRGAWWNETTKKPYPDNKTQEIDNLYRKALAMGDKSAVPPASSGAPDGADFKLGGGVQYKKENGQWKNMALNKPITDPKTAQHLETEYNKQKDKKGSGATLTRNAAANDDSGAAPTGAKFKQNDKGVEYTRTKDGWVDPKGKVIDNESQVAILDRGYNNSKKKGGMTA